MRVRNACVRHAAARLGLKEPDDAALAALPADAGVAAAMQLLRGAEREERVDAVSARTPLLWPALRAAAITLLALALSYGPVG